MKVLKHPVYTSLDVLVAESTADKAVAGKFYVPVSGKTLLSMAGNAYGTASWSTAKMINTSAYNMSRLVYRTNSASCTSGKVDGVVALDNSQYDKGAWIALCPVDKDGIAGQGYGSALGVNYQVIWVPTGDGKEPWDLDEGGTPGGKSGTGEGFGKFYLKQKTCPDGTKLTWTSLQKEPSCPSAEVAMKEKTCPDGSVVYWYADEAEPACGETETTKAGFPWWLALLLGGGAVVTVIVSRMKSKKGKKKKGRR